MNYLNFDDYKGHFGYANDYSLGGTSFALRDLVDISIYPGVITPLKPVPIPSVNTAIPTIVISDPRTSTGGGTSGGGSGSTTTSVRNYSAFVKSRWNELDGLPGKGSSDSERRANAGKFTRIIAYEIRNGLNGAVADPRAGLWQKRTDSTVQDRDSDKVVFLLGDGFVAFCDIIIGAGDPNPAPSWQGPEVEEGGAAKTSDAATSQGWVEPQPEPGVHI